MKDKEAVGNPKFNYNELAQKVEAADNNIRILQSFLTQMGRSIQAMQGDLNQSITLQKSQHYRTKAQQELIADLIGRMGGDCNKVDEVISTRMLELQVNDFNEESDRDDIANGYVLDDVATEDSIVIITSCTPDEQIDKGVLRSKVSIQDLNHDELKTNLIGKKAGDVVETMIQNVKHVITVIGVRKATAAPEAPAEVQE